MSYRKLLVAIDFSDQAALLCEKAKGLATRFSAELVLVHVVEPIMMESTYGAGALSAIELETELVDHARTKLSQLAERFGIMPDACRVEVGATKHCVSLVAEEIVADLIVVGSHGRHGFALLFGSTADAVLHEAPCDLLAVRLKQ